MINDGNGRYFNDGRNQIADAPPAEAAYRAAVDPNRSCGTCSHRRGGVCGRWMANVENDMVCDSWLKGRVSKARTVEPETNMKSDQDTLGQYTALSEMFFSGDEIKDEDGLFWKEILCEGRWEETPGPNGAPQPVPLTVMSGSGTVASPYGITVGLDDVLQSFEQWEEKVTVPQSHDNKPLENTGYVRQLKIKKKDNGRDALFAGIEFGDNQAKSMAFDGTLPGTSAGLLFNVSDHKGKSFPVVMEHVALTAKPWMKGMESFSTNFSEEDKTFALQFADSSSSDSKEGESSKDSEAGSGEPEIMWDQTNGLMWRQNQVQQALDANQDIPPSEDDQNPAYQVVDLNDQQALVVDSAGNDTFIVPYTVNNGTVALAPAAQWQHAQRSGQVAPGKPASQTSQQGSGSTGVSQSYSEEASAAVPVTETAPSTPEARLQRAAEIRRMNFRDFTENERKKDAESGAAEPDGSYPIQNAGDLRNAIRAYGRSKDPAKTKAHIISRAKALGLSHMLPSGWGVSLSEGSTRDFPRGGETHMDPNKDEKETTEETPKVDPQVTVQLSEAQSTISRQQDQINTLSERLKASWVKGRMEELKKMGFSEYPGFLTKVESIYLSDDGAEALLLSEETDGKTVQSTLTATQIVDSLIDAMPKDDEGRLKLSEQATLLPGDKKPEADTSKEVPHEDKVAEAAAWLGGVVAKQFSEKK